MSKRWYVIANAAQARVYFTDDLVDRLTLKETLQHPESRLKGSDINADRAGSFQSGGAHGGFSERTSPKAVEADKFAREISEYLDLARSRNDYDDLIIASSPPFHGLLNKHLNKQVQRQISRHIEKDLTAVADHEIDKTVRSYL